MSLLEKHIFIYLWVSVLIMLTALCLFVLTLLSFLSIRKKVLENPMVLSWCLLILPGVLMISVYLVQNIRNLMFHQAPETGAICNFNAFCAVTAVVTMNGSSVTVAYLTYDWAHRGKKPSYHKVLAGNFLSWMAGLTISSAFLVKDSFGPYMGLYCCVKEEVYHSFQVVLVFGLFGISVTTQSALYAKSYKEIKRREKAVVSTSTESESASVIVDRAIEMVSIFYCAWLLIILEAATVFSGKELNIWIPITGAWAAKMEPLVHAILLYKVLSKMKKTATAVAPLQSPIYPWLHGPQLVSSPKPSFSAEFKNPNDEFSPPV